MVVAVLCARGGLIQVCCACPFFRFKNQNNKFVVHLPQLPTHSEMGLGRNFRYAKTFRPELKGNANPTASREGAYVYLLCVCVVFLNACLYMLCPPGGAAFLCQMPPLLMLLEDLLASTFVLNSIDANVYQRISLLLESESARVGLHLQWRHLCAARDPDARVLPSVTEIDAMAWRKLLARPGEPLSATRRLQQTLSHLAGPECPFRVEVDGIEPWADSVEPLVFATNLAKDHGVADRGRPPTAAQLRDLVPALIAEQQGICDDYFRPIAPSDVGPRADEALAAAGPAPSTIDFADRIAIWFRSCSSIGVLQQLVYVKTLSGMKFCVPRHCVWFIALPKKVSDPH